MINDACNCAFRCGLCHVCTDMFSCTCLVYVDKMLPCKHIHIAMMHRDESKIQAEINLIPDNIISEHEDSTQILANDQEHINENLGQNLFDQKRQLVISKINDLSADRDDILEKILSLFKNKDFKQEISEITNKKLNIDHQLDFRPKTKVKKISAPSINYFACLNYGTNITNKNLLWCSSSVI